MGYMRTLLSIALVCALFIPVVHAQDIADSEVEIVRSSGLGSDPLLLIPIVMGLIVSLLLWRFLLPTSLSNLQVAFEIDDDFYEVHRLTKNRSDALKIIRPRTVFFGVILYLMAMAGIMILLSDILDDSLIWNRGPTYYQPALALTAFHLKFLKLLKSVERLC